MPFNYAIFPILHSLERFEFSRSQKYGHQTSKIKYSAERASIFSNEYIEGDRSIYNIEIAIQVKFFHISQLPMPRKIPRNFSVKCFSTKIGR